MAAEARYLGHQERIELIVRRHIAVLVPPAFHAVAAMVVAAVVGFWTSPNEGGDFIDTVFGLGAVFYFGRGGWKLWQWWVDRMVVTNQRIFEVSGILTRSVASMPLDRVTDMTYRRSVLGRILGYGEMTVESAGQDQALTRIDHVPHPDEFYRIVTSLMVAGTGKEPGGPPTPPPLQGPEPDDQDTGPLPRVIV